jgi:hypothetical protein
MSTVNDLIALWNFVAVEADGATARPDKNGRSVETKPSLHCQLFWQTHQR